MLLPPTTSSLLNTYSVVAALIVQLRRFTECLAGNTDSVGAAFTKRRWQARFLISLLVSPAYVPTHIADVKVGEPAVSLC